MRNRVIICSAVGSLLAMSAGCNRHANEVGPVEGADHIIAVNSSAIQIKDIANDAIDQSNLGDTEPSIAVNPASIDEIAIVAFSEPWGPDRMAPVWKSRDGGSSWKKIPQIPAPPSPDSELEGPGDQKIAFDSTGRLFVVELGFDPAKDFVYRQTGAPDQPLTAVSTYGDDQPHLESDTSSTGACRDVLYTAWLKTRRPDSSERDRSMDSWSKDRGTSLADVVVGDNRAFPNRTTRVAIGPDGKGYIVYKTREGMIDADFERVHFRVKRSDNCGTTWDALGTDSGISIHGNDQAQTLFTDRFGNLSGKFGAEQKVARARSSDAWIAVAPSSTDIYACYVNRDDSKFSQIYVSRSTDQGKSWTWKRLTDGKHHAGYPEISVSPNGAVGLLYIDYDDSGKNTLFRHHFARSFDYGKTWDDQIVQSMDVNPIGNAKSGFLWGDYEGLTSAGNSFYGVFAGASVNRTTLQLDPIFFKAPATK
ncbi:MAG: hypothetical protein WCD43_01480 [Candidatus Acidiferrales bacterium]